METATASASAGDARAASGPLATVGSWVFWIAAGLIAAGVAIRFSTLGLQSYHHDEVITAGRVLPGSFGHMMHEVKRSESTPPLYYILAWFWSKHFGLHEVELRSLSAIFGVLTLPFAFFVGRELAGNRAGLLLTAMAAFNPMLIWYSQEARAYALMVLLCTVSLLFFLRYRRRRSGVDLALWFAFSALALTSHYFSAFPIGIEAGWLLVENRRSRAVWLAIAGVVATGLALLPLATHQANPTHIDWIGNIPLLDRLGDSGSSFLIGETGRVIGAPHPRVGYAIAPLILLAVLVVAGAMRGERREWRRAGVGLAIGLGSLALILLAVAVGKDYVLARNLLPALVPLMAALAVIAVFARLKRLGLALIVALCAYWLAFDVYVDATPSLQRPDWKQVANAVQKTSRPRLIVTWTLGAAPLEYYLDDGTVQSKIGPFRSSEVDVISKSTATRFHSPLSAWFRRAEVNHLGRFTVTRWVAPHPMLLGLHLLRHLRTGFLSNAVMVGGPQGRPAPPSSHLPTCPPGSGHCKRPAKARGRHLLHQLHRLHRLRRLQRRHALTPHQQRQLRRLERPRSLRRLERFARHHRARERRQRFSRSETVSRAQRPASARHAAR
jgi:mannosyltransferase